MTEESLFAAALEVVPAEREAFLDRECPEPELRRQVARLLRLVAGAGRFLEEPAVAARPGADASDPAATASGPPSEGPGTRVGPYKLLQKIGEGGMGAVYMSEQEHPVRRKVALKIIRPGMESDQVVARFEAERQALALMDHPNIARVLDAGVTDNGRPYFVMELVKGIPITEYCDQTRLTPRQRLELFVPVCQAIQHAHQKGVIHRDVKPTNVLVTLYDGKPVPKVIDFGIAKAVEQRLTERTLFTQFGTVVGTFEYMSPEQAELSALDVDTRSDVYSLGVLLYELLTGTTPLEREQLRQSAYGEILRRIKEEESPKPSTRLGASGEKLASIAATRGTDPARLTRVVRGDLDWVVMKALEKDRTRRYESASGFARDVERYLEGDAVEAGGPSAWYRFSKFARRNRTSLTTVGLVGLSLLIGTVVSTWQAVEARKARRATAAALIQAQSRADETQQAVDYLIHDVFGAATPQRAQGRTVTVRALLDQADAAIATRFRNQPRIEARCRLALAEADGYQGDFHRASRHTARAVELLTKEIGLTHRETLAARHAELRALGGELWGEPTKVVELERLARPLLVDCRRVLGPRHPLTLFTTGWLAGNLVLLHQLDEAETLAGPALTLAEEVYGPRDPVTFDLRRCLASVARSRKEFARAEALQRAVVEGRRQLLGTFDPQTLYDLNDLALIVRDRGHTAEARRLYNEVLDQAWQAFGPTQIQASGPLREYVDLLRAERDYAAIRDLCERWLREILVMPAESDPFQRDRRVIRLRGLVRDLATLPDSVPIDSDLAVRAAEEVGRLSDGKSGRVTFALLLSRAGQADLAMQALRKAKARPDWAQVEDDYCWLVEALIHARCGDLTEARRLYDLARERSKPVAFGQQPYEGLQRSTEGLLAAGGLLPGR